MVLLLVLSIEWNLLLKCWCICVRCGRLRGDDVVAAARGGAVAVTRSRTPITINYYNFVENFPTHAAGAATVAWDDS